MIKITKDSNFYIKVSGKENLELLSRELFDNYPDLGWSYSEDKTPIIKVLVETECPEDCKKIFNMEKEVYIHINPYFNLSYTIHRSTAKDSGLLIIDYKEYNTTKSQLLSWLNK